MQINMQDTGTFLFISDHCHVIENVSLLPAYFHRRSKLLGSRSDSSSHRRHADIDSSGATVFLKAGWLATIQHGSGAPSGSSISSALPEVKSYPAMTRRHLCSW
jgi:hypothetical protein